MRSLFAVLASAGIVKARTKGERVQRSGAEPHGGARVVTAAVVIALAASAVSQSEAAPGLPPAACRAIPQISTHQFPDSPSITNPFLPMAPGMQFVYDGVVFVDRHPHPHQIVSTITDLTKIVDGVRTMVVFEQDFQDGVLEESELFF